jgi:hypothetical protein
MAILRKKQMAQNNVPHEIEEEPNLPKDYQEK